MIGLELVKIRDKWIQSYEMDCYCYYPPARCLRLLTGEVFTALKLKGYPFIDLQEKLDATWMTVSVDIRYMKDVTITGKDAPVALYASYLRRTNAVFLAGITAVLNGETIAELEARAIPVSLKQRKGIPTVQVAEKLNAPEIPLVEGLLPRLAVPENMEHAFDQEIRYYDCDRNGHLSAFRYADFVTQVSGYWSAGHHISPDRLQLEYASECMPGDVLSIYKADTEEGTYVKGVKQDGKLSFKALMKLKD